MVHTVPVRQEKELVNLSRQQKITHTPKNNKIKIKMLEQNGGRARATGYKQNSGLRWKKISPKSRIQATDPKPPNKIFREHWKREISCCQAQRHQTRPIKTGCANGLTQSPPITEQSQKALLLIYLFFFPRQISSSFCSAGG